MIPARTHPVHLVFGLVVWSVWFVAAYGGLSVGCAFAPPDVTQGALTWINGMLLVLILASVGLLLWLSLYCWRARASAGPDRPRQFIARIGAAVYVVSAAAVLFIGLPSVALPPCV
jgi:heme/copper-type cytochrome/quinol oxidase subunit 2